MSDPWFALFLAIGAAVWLWRIWVEGPYVSKPNEEERSRAWTESWRKSWHEAHVRIATGEDLIEGSQHATVPAGERLIMSFPVLLCENQASIRRATFGERRSRRTVWSHGSDARTALIIEPVDAGVLVVTDKRVVFTGANKHKDFPIDELLVDSTNNTAMGIALHKPGYRKIAYFTRMRELWITIHVTSVISGAPGVHGITHSFAGHNLEAVLGLLKRAASPEPM